MKGDVDHSRPVLPGKFLIFIWVAQVLLRSTQATLAASSPCQLQSDVNGLSNIRWTAKPIPCLGLITRLSPLSCSPEMACQHPQSPLLINGFSQIACYLVT